MSDIVCIATIILAAIVQASLQFGLGGLVMLCHNSLGKHRLRRTNRLARSYILGVAAISFLMICTFCFLIGNCFGGALSIEGLVICVGILMACSLVMWLFYYRKGKRSTELWLPKSFTNFIRRKARATDDDIEAFSLGMLSSFAEMPLSLALYCISANCIVNMSGSLQVIAAVGYTAVTIVPMVIMKLTIRSGKSAIDAQKWRVNNKAFSKFFSGSSFMLLAVFLLAFWIV